MEMGRSPNLNKNKAQKNDSIQGAQPVESEPPIETGTVDCKGPNKEVTKDPKKKGMILGKAKICLTLNIL